VYRVKHPLGSIEQSTWKSKSSLAAHVTHEWVKVSDNRKKNNYYQMRGFFRDCCTAGGALRLLLDIAGVNKVEEEQAMW
jgi:hypothetical protein